MLIPQLLTRGFDLDSLDTLRHSRPRGMISLNRFERRFAYGSGELEGLVNMPAGSARTNPFAARLQRFMSAALDAVALRVLREGDFDEAIAWFRQQPLAEFENRTAERVVSEGEAAALLRHLGDRSQPH